MVGWRALGPQRYIAPDLLTEQTAFLPPAETIWKKICLSSGPVLYAKSIIISLVSTDAALMPVGIIHHNAGDLDTGINELCQGQRCKRRKIKCSYSSENSHR